MASWGTQFSTGDQFRGSREDFWKSGFKVCQSCGKSKITSRTEVAGCRHNGDGYGTEVFTCGECGWETSFQYDEAGDSYYYETRYWGNRAPPPVAPPQPKVISEEKRKVYLQLKKLAPSEAVEQVMRRDGCSEECIQELMAQK